MRKKFLHVEVNSASKSGPLGPVLSAAIHPAATFLALNILSSCACPQQLRILGTMGQVAAVPGWCFAMQCESWPSY